MKKRLTDRDPERDAQYVKQKLEAKRLPFVLRCLCVLENLLDKYTRPRCPEGVDEVLSCVGLLADTAGTGKQVAVVGCGPTPSIIRDLADRGYRAVGIEPVPEGVEQANRYLAGRAEVIEGTAEHIPLENASQALVLMECVLEHVDSVAISLAEVYRVLKPGGVLFVRTTNRTRFSLTGLNWEYKVRFYNWFPRAVKESYVFVQLHYRPELASYTSRPAVRWPNFPDLCEWGRQAGFGQFYSPYDLLYLTRKDKLRPLLFSILHWWHRRPWIRAFAVSQMNGEIFMWKRNSRQARESCE